MGVKLNTIERRHVDVSTHLYHRTRKMVETIHKANETELLAFLTLRHVGDSFGGQRLNQYIQNAFGTQRISGYFYQSVKGHALELCEHVDHEAFVKEDKAFFKACNNVFDLHTELFDEMEAGRSHIKNYALEQPKPSSCNRYKLLGATLGVGLLSVATMALAIKARSDSNLSI